MILKFKGIVNATSKDIGVDDWKVGARVGDRNIVEEVLKTRFNDMVTVVIADERFFGELTALEYDSWWSEWTPGDPERLFCGKNDLIEILEERYNGKEITMWIADEPVNVLEDSELSEI